MKRAPIILILLYYFVLNASAQNPGNYYQYPTEERFINDICFTMHGGALAIPDNKTIKVFETTTNHLIANFQAAHRKQILSVDISTDSTLLVSGARDSTVVIWNFLTEEPLKSLHFDGIITSVDISPDNAFLAIGTSNNKAYIYDLKAYRKVYEFSDHQDDITAVAFSACGRYLATAGGDHVINMYSTENGRLQSVLKGHKNWVRDISFSPDSTKLASCGDDSKVIIWNISDIQDPKIHEEYFAGQGWLLCVDFYTDSQAYAYGALGGHTEISSLFASYSAKVKVPVNKVLFKPNDGGSFKIILATRGKGVIRLGVNSLKFKGKNL